MTSSSILELQRSKWPETLTEDMLREERSEPAVYTRELARRIRQGLVLRERAGGYTAASTGTLSPVETDTHAEQGRGSQGWFSAIRARDMIVVAAWGGQPASSFRCSTLWFYSSNGAYERRGETWKS